MESAGPFICTLVWTQNSTCSTSSDVATSVLHIPVIHTKKTKTTWLSTHSSSPVQLDSFIKSKEKQSPRTPQSQHHKHFTVCSARSKLRHFFTVHVRLFKANAQILAHCPILTADPAKTGRLCWLITDLLRLTLHENLTFTPELLPAYHSKNKTKVLGVPV